MRVALSFAEPNLPTGLTQALLRSIVRESCLLALPKLFAGAGRGVKLEIVLATDKEIQALNREYRGKDKPTDVLSFGEYTSPRAVARAKEKTIALGTLILSPPFIRRSAKEDGVSWEREFIFVFSHGVLHLLGFDHETRMFAIQDEITERFTPLKKQKLL